MWIISSLEIVQFCQESPQSRPVPLDMASLNLWDNAFSSLELFYELSHDNAKELFVASPWVVRFFGMFRSEANQYSVATQSNDIIEHSLFDVESLLCARVYIKLRLIRFLGYIVRLTSREDA